MVRRVKATIQGIVQGIGFRPFIYNLAKKYDLNGYILNTSSGVEIEVEGNLEQIELFFETIQNNNLPLAHITSIERTNLSPVRYQDFVIRESIASAERTTLIAPDICVCDDCLAEMRNPNNRRYRYPFINCTNCGPRYTIIEDIPYDRPKTSMRMFQMCDACQREYDDPSNRRFHAQPNACPVCGPQIELYDVSRKKMVDDPLKITIELLKQGLIVAIKGLGGFHLAVDAGNDEAAIRLRQRKNREEKPLAIMSLTLDRIRKYAYISSAEEQLLTSPQRPIVLLRKKQPNPIAEQVAPKNPNIGFMLPYTPLHYLLLDDDEILALVMTSGNLSEEPIVIDNDDAFERLAKVADYFLIHNRDIYLRSDDSVVRRISGENRIIRRSRGYVPQPIFLHKKFPQILACGAELKNTICLTKGKNAFLSQHIGDLKNLESYEFFDLTVRHLKQILDIEPEIVAYDLHPDYLSTRYALEQTGVILIGVQHHHAHIASCMLEHGLEEPVIGLSFDGTGYGSDGKIWGGEVLLVDGAEFSRLAHLEYLPMPGGDMAIKEPWRMAISYLYQAFGEDLWNLNLPILEQFDRGKIQFIIEMIEKGLNCPETSSLGRLFDGISALLGICCRSTYEGQAAIMLEMEINDQRSDEFYNYEWSRGKESYLISPKSIIKGIVDDFMNGIGSNVISYKFHLTLIKLFTDLCLQLKKETGIDRIVLSGGVFQNATLLSGLSRELIKQRFRVFSHSKVPTNDGGIALGQAAVAAGHK